MASSKLFTAHRRGFFAGRRPRVMGHRGAAGERPENTLESFRLALEQGADILEMDVRRSADGRAMVIHDATVDRTTSGSGSVAQMTASEVKGLDAGYRFTADCGKTFPFRGAGCRIPTFDEVLAEFPQVPINVEVKDNDDMLIARVVESLERSGRLESANVVVAASDGALAKRLRKAAPLALTSFSRPELIWLTAVSKLRLPGLLVPAGGDAVQAPVKHGWISVITPAFVRLAHSIGLEVHAWTINDEEEMRSLLQMGVDGIFTDYPARLRALIDREFTNR